ncbi:acyltransferase, partial [Bacillus subtilis]
FRKQGFKALSINKYKKSTLIRTILLGVILLPTIFIFAGTFDRLGKDQINNKSTSYNTAEIDKYMVRPIPVDDVNFLGDSNFKKDKDNEVYTDLSPLLIGDSVMVDIGETFKTHVPNATIDGKVGRNLYEAIPLTDEKYKSYNYKSKQVILELGTNGDFSEVQLDELIGKYGKANVYLINTRVPRSYEGHV